MLTRNVPRALGALALIAAAFAVIAAGAVPAIGAQITNVFVKNDANNPVPTAAQGVTQVAGTVSVAAPPEQVVRVRETLQNDPATTNVVGPLYDVPDGKRLIVDRVSANLPAIADTDIIVEVGQHNGPQFTLPLTQTPVGGDFVRYVANVAGPIYIDAVDGQVGELAARVLRGSPRPPEALAYSFTVNGRLVDAP